MSDKTKYINLTPDSFENEVINSELPVLVDFWAAWCGPCRVMNPIVKNIAENFDGRVKVAKADVEQNEAFATQYNVQAIPTILIFQQGKIIQRLPGLTSQAVLEEKLENLTAKTIAA